MASMAAGREEGRGPEAPGGRGRKGWSRGSWGKRRALPARTGKKVVADERKDIRQSENAPRGVLRKSHPSILLNRNNR